MLSLLCSRPADPRHHSLWGLLAQQHFPHRHCGAGGGGRPAPDALCQPLARVRGGVGADGDPVVSCRQAQLACTGRLAGQAVCLPSCALSTLPSCSAKPTAHQLCLCLVHPRRLVDGKVYATQRSRSVDPNGWFSSAPGAEPNSPFDAPFHVSERHSLEGAAAAHCPGAYC